MSYHQSRCYLVRCIMDSIVRLHIDVTVALNSKRCVMITFLDIEQEFEKVWHEGLLHIHEHPSSCPSCLSLSNQLSQFTNDTALWVTSHSFDKELRILSDEDDGRNSSEDGDSNPIPAKLR